MCGISGVLLLDGSRVERSILDAQTRALAHRGPDGAGHWIDPSGTAGLGHRRLAIIDLSESASQPMGYRGRYTITYNGEIYNYLELRAELLARGCSFRTHSDTEVLLAAYAEFGEGALEKLDGMYAFAIWDEQEQQLFCARDRFGEKPFYYAYRPGRHFVFASEIKGLLAAGVETRVSPRALYQYLAFDVVQNPHRPEDTFYEAVHSLKPAHTMTVRRDRGVLPARRYWQIPAPGAHPLPNVSDAADRVLQLLKESVRRRLRSDVPVGSSLSGGLDSSSIVCLMRQLREAEPPTQNSFSARFRDARLDEGRFMDLVIGATGVQSHFVWPDAAGLAANLARILHHQEEPFGGASVYAQWEVMRLARDSGVKVLLDGQGADETLAGYLHFFQPYLKGLFARDRRRFEVERRAYESRHQRQLPIDLRFRLDAMAPRLTRALAAARRSLGAAKAPDWLAPDLVRHHGNDRPPFRNFECLDSALRFFSQDYGLRNLLRYADRNSMAFGREVRLPFLAHDLVEFIFTLPDEQKLGNGWTKLVLREAVVGIVPEEVRLRVDKLGFETPESDWLAAPSVSHLVSEATRVLKEEGILVAAPPKGAEWRVLMAGTMLRSPLQTTPPP